MSLNRFEAFSDGVFAIAVTLLVIEIKAPDLSQATSSETVAKLLQVFPHVLSYATSFIVIGVIWINHHALFHFIKRVDRTILVINLLLLMCVAFIPYPTALIGEYGTSLPVVVFYGLTLALTGFAYNTLWFYVVRRYITSEKIIHQKTVQKATIWTLSYPISYLVAAGLAFININLSIVLYILIPLFYLLPGIIDKQLMEQV
ncbi:TMEM175 family protein [Nostoc sp.]|uniref:TMEM175 family protein n=1 Tax=Nostoc sp. TaxID=1180 RepID=UPI002FF68FE9